MNLIDSHAHLSSEMIFEQADAIAHRAAEAGIQAVINICTDETTLRHGLQLAKKYPWIHNAAATTPHDVEKEGESLFPLMEFHARQGDLVAIGETGLDYHYLHADAEIQQHFLRRYLHLALDTKLPVIIHCREAFSDFFHILDTEYTFNGRHAPGVLHCFTGTVKEAEQIVARDWFLSLSGIVTFKKSDSLREVAKMTPLDRLLIETDSPYLAPQSRRGKTNEPSFLPEIASLIAGVKGIAPEEVASATAANARHLFHL
jgi:TatD DNase family protein